MTVYFLAADTQQPFGGIRKMYDFVDHLNEAGIDAFVVHTKRGYRCSWFPNSTRIIEASAVKATTTDLLVVSEFRAAELLDRLPIAVPKVLLIQGPYVMFRDLPFEVRREVPSYNREDVLGAVVVSEDSARYISYVFPHLPVRRVRLGIDNQLYFRDPKGRELQLAFAPRKRPAQARQVVHALRARGALQGWNIQPISGASAAETAEILRRSSVYLNFAHPEGEGFSLMPLEAMACGCLVVGQTGCGGDEFFKADFSVPTPNGSTFAVTELTERVLNSYRDRREDYERMGTEASDFVQANYTLRHEREDVVAAFAAFLDGMGSGGQQAFRGLDLSPLARASRIRRVMYYLRAAAYAAVSDSDIE